MEKLFIEKYRGMNILQDKKTKEYQSEGNGMYLKNFISFNVLKIEIDNYLDGQFDWED